MGRGQQSTGAATALVDVAGSGPGIEPRSRAEAIRPPENQVLVMTSARQRLVEERTEPLEYQSDPAPYPGKVREITYPKRSLLVIGGPPGIGKTTLMERVFGEEVETVCPDELRLEMQEKRGLGNGYIPELWPEVYQALAEKVDDALEAGRPIAVHGTALSRAQQVQLTRMINKERGDQAHLLLLDGDRDLCAQGQENRERKVPDSEMDIYHERLEEFKRDLLDPAERSASYQDELKFSLPHSSDPERWMRINGKGFDLVHGRGFASCSILDRQAVNRLERISFES